MTIRTINIQIESGENTCAVEPGKFCRFVGTTNFGTKHICMLFPNENPGARDQGAYTVLKEKDGWLQRCDACKLSAK